MVKPKYLLVAAILLCAVLCSSFAVAQTTEESKSLALFRRNVAPSYLWGQDGVITIPQVDMIGPWKLATSGVWTDAGTFRGEDLLDSKYSFIFCPNPNMEFGYTRKELIFMDDLKRSPVHADIYNMKLKIFDFKKDYLPKFGASVYGFEVNDVDDFAASNVYLNLAGVITEDIPFKLPGLKESNLGIHAGVEFGLLETTQTDPFFFGGVDLEFLKEWIMQVVLLGEYVGANEEGENGIINAGIAFNLYEIVQLGVAVYDVGAQEFEQGNIMAQASVTIPIAKIWNKFFSDIKRLPESEEDYE